MFFRQYPSLLLTQTTLTLTCGCSWPAKSPCTGCYSSCSYLYYLCSYMLLSELCCYWFSWHCRVWFSAPFDMTLLFCSLYCLCFCPQSYVGWVSKDTSHDTETKSVVAPDIQRKPLKPNPPISTSALRGGRVYYADTCIITPDLC